MRILRLGRRKGDGAELAMVELIGSEPEFDVTPSKKKSVGQRVAARLKGKKKPAAEDQEETKAVQAAEDTAEEITEKEEDTSKRAHNYRAGLRIRLLWNPGVQSPPRGGH